MVFSGDPLAATPFETHLDAELAWTQVVLPWQAFERAEWADTTGLQEIDPARMVGYGFNVDAGESSVRGALWIDDVRLYTGPIEEAAPAPAATSTPEPAATPTLEPTATSTVEPTATPSPPSGKPALAATATPEPAKQAEKPSRSLCPLSAMILPVGGVAFVLSRQRRQPSRR